MKRPPAATGTRQAAAAAGRAATASRPPPPAQAAAIPTASRCRPRNRPRQPAPGLWRPRTAPPPAARCRARSASPPAATPLQLQHHRHGVLRQRLDAKRLAIDQRLEPLLAKLLRRRHVQRARQRAGLDLQRLGVRVGQPVVLRLAVGQLCSLPLYRRGRGRGWGLRVAADQRQRQREFGQLAIGQPVRQLLARGQRRAAFRLVRPVELRGRQRARLHHRRQRGGQRAVDSQRHAERDGDGFRQLFHVRQRLGDGQLERGGRGAPLSRRGRGRGWGLAFQRHADREPKRQQLRAADDVFVDPPLSHRGRGRGWAAQAHRPIPGRRPAGPAAPPATRPPSPATAAAGTIPRTPAARRRSRAEAAAEAGVIRRPASITASGWPHFTLPQAPRSRPRPSQAATS